MLNGSGNGGVRKSIELEWRSLHIPQLDGLFFCLSVEVAWVFFLVLLVLLLPSVLLLLSVLLSTFSVLLQLFQA